MESKWMKFEDRLPTEVVGEQVKILFGHPKWATWFVGFYDHFPEETLKERVWSYELDKYIEWVSMTPTHWMYSPANPTE